MQPNPNELCMLMKYLLSTCLPLALAAMLPVQGMAASPQQEPESISLNFKQVKKWNIKLPNESWSTIRDELRIPNGEASGFMVDNGPFKLQIDTDGNGRTDDVVKGVAGDALLKGKHEDGTKFSYAVRVRRERDSWQFACGGLMTGKIHGVQISLIDQNNNGIWNEIGTDAMIVGKGSAASYLSKVINVKGQLLEFSVNEQGNSATLSPFQGETGVINAVEKYNSKGKLTSAVFSSVDGDYSFELSSASKGLTVPINEYELSSATAAKSVEHVRIRRGGMRGITVKTGDERFVEWGGPLRIEFTHYRTDEETVTVNLPTFFGNAEEEYYDFFPGGKSPKILVTDKDTGKEVWSGKFCES
jgi:hypothetical protein